MAQNVAQHNWRNPNLSRKSYLTHSDGRTMTQHPAYNTHGTDRSSRWLITADHASNTVPDWVNGGDLGISDADMNRHIAYDVGSLGLARHLADALAAPMIASDFSRLVIDPNRGEDDPTLVMRLYDGTIIPANRHVDEAETEHRLSRLYRPYHGALADLAGQRDDTVICAIHSFTPCLKGRQPRPWEIGVLHSHQDSRLAVPLIEGLRDEGYCVGDNEPYSGHLPGDSIDRHALVPGRLNVLIELRNDLIGTDAEQALWANRLAAVLERVLASLPA